MKQIATGSWRLDPERSSVEFHVRHFYGLVTVKGRFHRYAGTLDLSRQPAVDLTIDADSLDTKNKKRDAHLRSADFFHVDEHPSAGSYPTAQPSTATRSRRVDGELEIAAEALADHRQLGMTWSPLGILRAPSKLIVRGRLVRED